MRTAHDCILTNHRCRVVNVMYVSYACIAKFGTHSLIYQCCVLSAGMYGQKVSDVAAVMLETVCKFSEKHQTSDLTVIQIVIFDASMCDGFAKALDSTVKNSQSQSWFRTVKRKSAEVCRKLLQRIKSNDYSFKQAGARHSRPRPTAGRCHLVN